MHKLNSARCLIKKFTVAIFSGGSPRPEMTSKALKSINEQTFPDIEKIFINGGRHESELNYLKNLGVLTSDWFVINFPIPIFDVSLVEAAYCIYVKSALASTSGEFFFGMNDDDHLAEDFFERMDKLFSKHPNAISGIGIMNRYFHSDSRIVPAPHGNDMYQDWRCRPEVEDGINLFREIYLHRNYFYNPNPGFAFVCKTEKIREVESSYLFGAGYPDNSCLIQVVSRGETIFDANAHMYWGRHENQEHFKYDARHYWNCSYKKLFNTIALTNIEFMKIFHPSLSKERKALKRYFKFQLIDSSLDALSTYLARKKLTRTNSRILPEFNSINKKFPMVKHILILFNSPHYVLKRIQKKLRLKFSLLHQK
jgi:hypothetical protein